MTHHATPGAGRRPASRQARTAWAAAAALLLAWAVFEAAKYGGWVIVAAVAGVVVPDLSLLLALSGPHRPGLMPPRAVPLYNLLHRPAVAFAVMLSCLVPDSKAVAVPLFNLGLAWLLHIAADRALGYGLRSADGRPR
ncbi:DUF4260 family protein [Streptomyces sp. CC210A]|uniref:DUF4260 family protein n=1 Tax=Streptomyces sp. CC210A TaxID=2898184 RepID=UPI001F3B11B8|nr:DUF4260 family protein [Streptomyces sp. CC210A]